MASFARVSAPLLGLFAIFGQYINNIWQNATSRANDDQLSAGRPDSSLVVATWADRDFQAATETAWKTLRSSGGDTLRAVINGCSACQELRCGGTVGYGGSPDEYGETTLDAMVMHGPTGDVGAVAGLKRIKDAVQVAAAVAKYTKHTLLVGESATKFALEMGFKEYDLHTTESVRLWKSWIQAQCQPNYWKSVVPDPRFHCGPYKPSSANYAHDNYEPSHDTVGMIAKHGSSISVATSTNGARHKISGRVGDSPIPGAGGFVDNDVGAACATGDGDILMRMLPSYQTVENMRNGMAPDRAAREALKRISKRYGRFKGAVVAVNSDGVAGGACHGFESFSFCVRAVEPDELRVINVTCTHDD